MRASLAGPDLKKALFLFGAQFLVLSFSNVCYFLPVYYGHLGYGPQAAGLLVAAFYIFSLAVRPFTASVLQLCGFRRLLLLAGVLSVGGGAGVAAAGTCFWASFLARGLLGVGSSFFQIALATYQAMAFAPDVRGRAFSLVTVGSLLPVMTALPVADWLVHHGHDFCYIAMPVAVAVAATLIMPLVPGLWSAEMPRGGRRNPLAGLGACFKLPLFPLAFMSMFLFSVSDATAAFMTSMTSHYGLMASFFLSCNGLVGVLVRLFFGRVLDKFPRWALAAPMTVITAGALLLASIDPSERSLMALGCVFGLGMGFGYPLHLALMSDGVPQALQPQAMALTWFLMGLDFAAVPLIMGWLGSLLGPVPTFRLICGLTLAGCAALALCWQRKMKGRAA